MNSCIGVVVNKTLDPGDPDYEWVDQGDIGIYSSGGTVNAIDPSVMRGHDGKIWLTYGSFNLDGIMVTEIDSVSGKPMNSTRTSIANSYTGSGYYFEGEGACQVYHDGYYYLFYNKGGCCNGILSSYYIVMGRSASPEGLFYDKAGKAMRIVRSPSGGTVLFRHDNLRGLEDRYFGPGHFALYSENGTDYVTFHYYDPNGDYNSTTKGRPTLGLAKLNWGEDGWPTLSFDFLDEGYYTLENVNSGKMVDTYQHEAIGNALLYQYAYDETYDSQKWLFTPLGTGEYTIRSYADNNLYVEGSGVDNNQTLRVTSNFTSEIYQKFRVAESPNGKLLIYPSVEDKVFDILNDFTADFQIRLYTNTNLDGQRWYAEPFIETFSVFASNVVFDYTASIIDTISVHSNGSWEVTVTDTTWLKVTPASGTGDQILSFEVTRNSRDTVRTNQVTIQSKGGSTAYIGVYQKANPVSSVNEHYLPEPVIYPNPADGKITISLNNPASLSIYDYVGNRVSVYQLPGSPANIDISHLNAGVYLFRISNENGSVVRKVIKL